MWEWPAEERVLIGQPRVRLRVSASAPAATLSVKLCDVFPDGTSALVTRGSLDLAYRDGVQASPSELTPGEEVDVELELDACAYAFEPGQRLRLSIAGADWPNTVAPPAPVQLTVHSGTVQLPLWSGDPSSAPVFTAGADCSEEDASEVVWATTDDVLRRTTTAKVSYGAAYPVPYDGTASEEYAGEVSVDRRSFAQQASASCTFRLTWPEAAVSVSSTMTVDIGSDGYDVRIEAVASEGAHVVRSRAWQEHIDR